MDMAPISASNKTLVTLDLFPNDKTDDDPEDASDNKQTEENINLAPLRFMTDEEQREEVRHNVSTKLTLYTDPWTIKKTLNKSSIGYLNHLFLNGSIVLSDILRYLPISDKRVVEEGPGLAVDVYDEDTDTMHTLVLKKRPRCQSYILGSAWRREFVVRKDLKIGDVIGMYWDPYESKLHFCVLSRSPIQELI
ncbi:PREDICTED: B3 domain-containing protein At2g33720-like [Camelina sativa]|uniref:B3 domain-containing protein At2g33720-like n=1 Tax=Camelina sativa TaxID=90675 RepID=A0ABM0ZMF5_CAMSA|nr:PREDICTED: B3 domain-containing protein At2g33720-like [Camelina sativa]